MKKTGKRLLLPILLVCVLLFSGCGRFSSYRAVMLIRTNTPHSAFMRFAALDGRMVFTLNPKGENGKLKASAKLASGSATVYLDDGTKREWFSLRGGEEAEWTSVLPDRDAVTLIVETNETCRDGEFRFDME